MKCPICGKEVELQKKQVGVDETGEPVFNQYAVCRDCRKQWNLDKRRAKKTAADTRPIASGAGVEQKNADIQSTSGETDAVKVTETSVEHVQPIMEEKSTPETAKDIKSADEKVRYDRDGVKAESADEKSVLVDEEKKESRPSSRPVKKQGAPRQQGKRPATGKRPPSGKQGSEQRYANIPPEKVRVKKEKAVKQAYEDMLATDPDYKPKKKKRPEEEKPVSKKSEQKKDSSKKGGKNRRAEKHKEAAPKAPFRVIRVLFGLASIGAFGYFAYCAAMEALDDIANATKSMTSAAYLVLALCMFISGLLLMVMQKRRTIFAFLLPMVFYAGGAVFAFLNQGGDKVLLYGAIAAAVLAVLMLILGITSRGGKDDPDDDYDDEDEE